MSLVVEVVEEEVVVVAVEVVTGEAVEVATEVVVVEEVVTEEVCSSKTYLDFWDCSGRENLSYSRTLYDLDTLGHS